MKQLHAKAISMMMSVLMLFSLLPSVQTFAATTTVDTVKSHGASDIKWSNYDWATNAFGQSTDLNFKSTIAADKVGLQGTIDTKINVSSDNGVTKQEKDAVVIESRGGKIANTHDGLTYYYTTLPTTKNFKLTANVFLNQLGPEASTGSTPSKQEGCGVMIRDCIGQQRKEPMEFGYEELPAASNVVANMLLATDKKIGATVAPTSYDRNGVLYPYGNSGAAKTQKALTKLGSDIVATTDRTPKDGVYDANLFLTLSVERKDDGFVISYTDQAGKEYSNVINGADRVSVIEKDKMYVGFFASRNAKMTITDVELTTSDANTVADGYTQKPYDATFDVCSAETSSTADYTVRLRSNYNGLVTIKQDGVEIATDENATKAAFYEKKTTLNNDQTKFEVTYVTDDATNSVKTAEFTVTKNEAFANKDLYVSDNGTADGEGTLEKPLDLQTALNYVSDGYTVYAKGGTYKALVMNESYTASSAKKTLCAYNDEQVIIEGTSQVDASNWNLKKLEFTGSSTTGFRLTGHSNTIELCKFYNNGDTGCQISGGSGTDPLNWPSNNYVVNCESYNNVDASRINADGFAAKLGVGEGNRFNGCISHNNADDGWDLYNKLEDGANEPVTIENCIAYENGKPYEGQAAEVGSIGNGFKLGGEGQPVDHVVKNCISYNNNMDGFTCNFNPGRISVTNCTAFDNARCNYIFRSNPYRTADKQGIYTNNISFRTNEAHTSNDYVSGTLKNCYLFENGNTVKADDFVTLDVPSTWTRTVDGSLVYGNFLRVKVNSTLATAGENGTYVGALEPTATVVVPTETPVVPTETPAVPTNKPVVPTNKPVQPTNKPVEKKYYKVSFNANGGSCKTSSVTCENGTKIKSLPTATKAGYTFKGWYTAKKGGTKVTVSSLAKDSKNCTVYAQWTAKKYTVKLNANGGFIGKTSVKSKTTTVSYNGKYQLTTPKRNGYTFAGWYTKKTGGSKVTAKTAVKVTKNTTLYAHWNKVTVGNTKVTSIKNVKSKKAVVTAKAVKGAQGYEVRYSTKSNLKNAKTITSKSAKNVTIKKLSKNKKYYVQVRAYKIDSNGKRVYGKWSSTKTVTIKK